MVERDVVAFSYREREDDFNSAALIEAAAFYWTAAEWNLGGIGHTGGGCPVSSDPDDNTNSAKVRGIIGLPVKTLRKRKKRSCAPVFFLDLLGYYLLLLLRRTILLPLQDLRKQPHVLRLAAAAAAGLKFSCSFALRRKWKEVGNCFPPSVLYTHRI